MSEQESGGVAVDSEVTPEEVEESVEETPAEDSGMEVVVVAAANDTGGGGEEEGGGGEDEKSVPEKIIEDSETVETLEGAVAGTSKENIVLVLNKVESPGGMENMSGGEMKLFSKPLAVVSGTGGAAAVLKKGTIVGNTIVKVQKAGTAQGSTLIGKKSVVIASRPAGMNQLIVQQPSIGSAPVVLTQKVAAGGVLTSPVVSTGRIGAAAVGSIGGGAKIISAATSSQESQQRIQDVRVDNWGNYCLQRLQTMYEKGDYCDLTLRFHSSQEIKVHRVVVNLCTEYFSNLEKLYGPNEGTLILPKDVEFQTMQNIIRFFYTGKLEVRGNQFNDIYRTVKMMNITILIKLLEAHSRKPVQQVKKEAGRQVILKQAVELAKGEPGHVQIQVATTNQPQISSPVIAVPVAGSKALQVAAPGVKLPPGIRTKTVLARVQSQTSKGQSSKSSKKLPIWKERKFTPTPQEPPKLEKWQIKEEEPARPTRFEWGDPDEFDPFFNPPALTNHTLMEKQREKHSTRKVEDIFDAVKNQQQTLTLSGSGTKRPKSPETDSTAETPSPSTEPPPSKMPKLVINQLTLVESGTEVGDCATTVTPEGMETEDHSETVTEPAVDNVIVDVPTPTLTLNENKVPEKKPVPILKPALKSPSRLGKDSDGKGKDGSPQKTVRFAPEVEKENKEKSATVATPSTSALIPTKAPTVAAPPKKVVSLPDSTDPLANHSKIISEVLRKFPDLVKDNKNIKLKIVQKSVDSPTIPTSSKDAKSKVSYIVLKSTSSPDVSSPTVLKKSPAQASTNKFWESDKTPKKQSLAENTTGPWICERCGEGENTALQFDTYYSFRRHLVDVHQERIDARICEHCGQKASKRNLLLYHLYTKHGVQPPKNCTFPHCDRCDYVALSESLLNKHKQNHDTNKEFSCSICSASFKSSAALQAHMTADLHRNKDTKVYECPYCTKPFVRNINLKAHIRSLHRDVARIEEMDDPKLPADELLLPKKFFSLTSKKRGFPSILTTARAGSSTGLVEFISADDLQSVSYITADGQPIEILDHGSLTSLPLTLVSQAEAEMATIAVSAASGVAVDGQIATATTTTAQTEYVTGITQEGSQEPVYVMDGTQGAVELDMSNMGLTVASDGAMVYEGEDPSQNFIIQDMQGNQYRRITGIDETGKPVMFLQLIGEDQIGMAPAILDESIAVDGAGSSQMFVSSAAVPIPVSTESVEGQQQVIFASAAPDGTFVEMVPTDGSGQEVVMSEAVLASEEQINEQQHLQLVQHDQSSGELQEITTHDELGQPVQELHIVLDQHEQDDSKEVQEQVVEDDSNMEIVEVQQPTAFTELQVTEQYGGGDTSIETTEIQTAPDQLQDASEIETQEMEIDENSQQLQIDEGPTPGPSHVLKIENMTTQSVHIDNDEEEDTQVITEDNLQGSIELVEGQTLTLIEEEDGTQTIEVGEEQVE